MGRHSFLWCAEDRVQSQQKGSFRVNCMDCLDRTNVVQSALARQFLDRSLARAGLRPPPAGENAELDQVFNSCEQAVFAKSS
jgi:hypothetical protein